MAFIQHGVGRIVFHKPHPDTKITQSRLQSWGRRMNRPFDWVRESFVVVDEQGEGKGDEVAGHD